MTLPHIVECVLHLLLQFGKLVPHGIIHKAYYCLLVLKNCMFMKHVLCNNRVHYINEVCVYICIYIYIYTGCPRRNVPDFGRVFLMLNYTDITQNTYVQSRTVMEIMAREKCGRHGCRNTIRRPWRHTCPMPLPDQRDMVMQWPWRVRYSTVALTSQFNRSAAACVKYLEV